MTQIILSALAMVLLAGLTAVVPPEAAPGIGSLAGACGTWLGFSIYSWRQGQRNKPSKGD